MILLQGNQTLEVADDFLETARHSPYPVMGFQQSVNTHLIGEKMFILQRRPF